MSIYTCETIYSKPHKKSASPIINWAHFPTQPGFILGGRNLTVVFGS